MRIALFNWTARMVGGVESYLAEIIPALQARGHDVSLVCEVAGPSDRSEFDLSPRVATWCLQDAGLDAVQQGLERWVPDVLWTHGLLDPEVEAACLDWAPAVITAHGYYGTCISGSKTFTFPRTVPCDKRFGWPCLLRYYPRRAGGFSPRAMWHQYRVQATRHQLLKRYRTILTLSDHMRAEYLRHGFPERCVTRLPPFASSAGAGARSADRVGRARDDAWRLIFVGRMDPLKGGGVLLEAIPRVASTLRAPVRVTFVGDGPARTRWSQRAVALSTADPSLAFDFTGWVASAHVRTLMAEADLLVLPSLWPEPTGLVGLEAGTVGLPVAAFRVGGIPEWLEDDVNGHLAPGNPPSARALADAISRCLHDPEHHVALQRGARRQATRYTLERHLDALERALVEAASTP